jgi:hypothetical protein
MIETLTTGRAFRGKNSTSFSASMPKSMHGRQSISTGKSRRIPNIRELGGQATDRAKKRIELRRGAVGLYLVPGFKGSLDVRNVAISGFASCPFGPATRRISKTVGNGIPNECAFRFTYCRFALEQQKCVQAKHTLCPMADVNWPRPILESFPDGREPSNGTMLRPPPLVLGELWSKDPWAVRFSRR